MFVSCTKRNSNDGSKGRDRENRRKVYGVCIVGVSDTVSVNGELDSEFDTIEKENR